MSIIEGMSPADFAAVTGSNNDFGSGAWWIIILFLFVFMGGKGFNNNAGTDSSSVYEGYVLNNDFSQLANKADAIGNGIADSTFALNNQINAGFTNTNNGLTQGFAGINQAVTSGFYQSTINGMQNSQAVQASINNAIEVSNNNTRAILEAMQQNKVESMQERIATLTAENQQLAFANSQAAQNATLISALKPCPVPAYQVANPYNSYNCCNGCGC